MLRFTALLLCLLLCGGWSHGRGPQTYFVNSATGNDSNDGLTTATPWQTLSKIQSSSFSSGDSVALNGASTFSGSLTLTEANAPSNLTLTSYSAGQPTINSGSSSCITATIFQWFTVNNINCHGSGGTVAAVNGIFVTSATSNHSFLGGPTITNNTVTGYGNTCVQVSPNGGGIIGITINGNTISDCAGVNGGNQEVACLNIVFASIQVVTINQNTISTCRGVHTGSGNTDAKGNGIEINGVFNVTVANNLIHDFGFNSDACGGPVGILTANTNAADIKFNEVYNGSTNGGCDGDGIDMDQGTVNSTVEYNYVHHNSTTELLGGDFAAVAVHNNVYRWNVIEASTGDSAFELWCDPGINDCANMAFYNNTIFRTDPPSPSQALLFMSPVDNPVGSNFNLTIANNIMYVAKFDDSVTFQVKSNGTLNITGNVWFTANNAGGATLTLIDNVLTYNNLAGMEAHGYETLPVGTPSGSGGTPIGLASNPNLTSVLGGGTCGTATTVGWNTSCPTAYTLSSSTPSGKGNGQNLNTLYGYNVGTQDFYGNTITNSTLPIGAAANK